ncbi:MAG: helix-turn-helix transcriptional regulator [Nitrospinae bacterium]|nr:helix-turn-helix transcriptional regulator [Nitrospinota bacterium]
MAILKEKSRQNKYDAACASDCPVRRSLEILDGKWTMLVLRDLMGGPKRFGVLRRSLNHINPKTLTDRLRHLEKHKIVSKKIFPEIPPRVEYKLTEKGMHLKQVIVALKKWGMEHL